MEDFPKELCNLPLTHLNLSKCNSLKKLPKEIGNLTKLVSFDLSFCKKLKTLPKEIGNLTSLNNISLSYCDKLQKLPKEIKNLNSPTLLLLGMKKLQKQAKRLKLIR